jgi:peptidoglycan hydrolase-like protein with peptidoglycan-binding domain
VADPPLTADGIMGPKTKLVVMAFQRARSLTIDGIVGPKTRAALRAALAAT